MPEWLQRMFEHMYWADERIATLLTAPAARPPADAVRVFAHVLAAERVWLLRMQGRDASGQPIWPDAMAGELEDGRAALRADYEHFLGSLSAGELDREVEYANSLGTRFRTRLVDILAHIALHGSYHRGQVAAAIRRDGGEPVNTDYIAWVREQY